MQSDFRKQELFSYAAMNVYQKKDTKFDASNPPGWKYLCNKASQRYKSEVRMHDKMMAEQAYKELLNSIGPDPHSPTPSIDGSLDVEG
jgi:hypothetical protein